MDKNHMTPKETNDITAVTAPTVYRLEFPQGRPVFTGDGKPLSSAAYCDFILRNKEEWIARYRDFVASSVHTYFLDERRDWDARMTQYWTDEDVYPIPAEDSEIFCLDAEARAVLAMDPEARFFVRITEMIPCAWQDKHPGEMQCDSDGIHQAREISLASELGNEHFFRYLRHLVQYCESRSWADRIIGYMPYSNAEGLTVLSTDGFVFDASPVMQQAFCEWVREHYLDENALRTAWNDPAITFDTVRVPTEAEWAAKRAASLHWPEPGMFRRERDYFELMQRLFRRFVRGSLHAIREGFAGRSRLVGLDAFKQPMLGWMIQMAFGMTFGRQEMIADPMGDFPEMTLGSGAIDIGDLLDEPGLDMLWTPADYTVRSVGFGWEPEGVSDSLRLRGKIIYVENDARSWVGDEAETQGAFRTPEEMRAGLLRNTAWALSRGQLQYWMIAGSSYFHDSVIHETAIRANRRIIDASNRWPHVETEHALCFVIDDSSPMHEDGTAGYQHIATLWQRHLGLAHCGVPYRIYLFSDLARDNMPAYRTYLFPNLFELNEERLALLRRQVLRDGHLAIFGPSTGITDGQKLGPDGLSRLLDMEFELMPVQAPRRVVLHGTHAVTRSLPACDTFGDSYPYGPILIPTRAAVEQGGFATLGRASVMWRINKPGLILKEFGRGAAGNGTPGARGSDDYAIAWTVAMPLPAALLREFARYAGSHIWCEEDAVVLASESIAALHSVKAGCHTLRLPSARPVWDLVSGRQLGEAVESIDLDMASPDTRLFFCGVENPFGSKQ